MAVGNAGKKPGPIPKRKEDLHGNRSKEELTGATVTKVSATAKAVTIPHAPKQAKKGEPDLPGQWHPTAYRIWESAKRSPYHKQYFQDTDWAVLFHCMEELTAYKRKGSSNGQILQSINNQLAELMLTEGARRRLGVEIDTAEEEDPGKRASVSIIDGMLSSYGQEGSA